MNVYLTKLNGLLPQDSSQYIQRMTAEIAHPLGFREMGIFRYNGAEESEESLSGRIDGIIAGAEWNNDAVICQFPTGNGLKYERKLIQRLRTYQIRVIIFLHDSKAFIQKSGQAASAETVGLYNQADVLIVPSPAMRQYLLDHGIKKDMKFVIQEMWDYTADSTFCSSPKFRREIHFADRSVFEGMNSWKGSVPLKLYGVSADQGLNVSNMGELSSGEFISALSKGGFGLVWYQDSESRRYMEYDASFSLSRYLAAGIPVIVPLGISNQTLIEKNHLGLAVSSLEEAVTAVESMSESEYQEYIRCVRQFSPALRNGYYTKKCLMDAVLAVCRKDAGEMVTPTKVYDMGEQAFTYVVLRESYGGNLALSWSYHGEPDGFLIYDSSGKLVYETRNPHQHYFLAKGYKKEDGFVIKAYIDTRKGKAIIAESKQVYLQELQYDHADVSLIIPAYNAEDYIARSIDTVLAQSFVNLELLIVNDGSTDRTQEIIDWYADNYHNVTGIYQENSGVPAARNTGIKNAKGEYIGFMDNDDMIHPDMVKRLYNSIRKNNCDIAITSVYQITNEGYKVFLQYPMEEDTMIETDDFFRMLFRIGWGVTVVVWNKLYRASLIKTHLFPLLICDDSAWTPYLMSYAEKICYRNDYLYEYDRMIRKSTLVDQWKNEEKEDRFMTYKKLTLFYLKEGNPKRRHFLKELAKRELLDAGRIYAYDAYKILWEEIDETF